ncbi:GNAT family N-acetyltransferase [Bacillus luteolus]|uniref:GNAT family N-acetyltransferase n=1 Tax=Litchfieldia luteola TaxID=682179 RepID=A0ABR9QIC0_9BACI|nr:GNAT family N-acetyltransferase [Cytobacillus luteolus]MBE4908239.1 GNAT family N-acetyltransferase [Cytobacillus luteolus]MBP1943025.1 putative acetyltransferase [Cytobacillus luteolus]
MNIEVLRVEKNEQQILHNIMQFYIYDFSQFINSIEVNEQGLYDPFNLEEYWIHENKHPFFIKVDDVLAGFVLVNSQTETSPASIAEFFILKKYAGKGIGKVVARRIFDMFLGDWKITQIAKNYPAQAFWRSVIKDYTNDQYSETYDNSRRSVQEFNNSEKK